MGTFAGHALPGSFFLMFGIWSTIFQLKKYYRRKKYELGFSGYPEPVYKNQFTTPIRCSERGCCCKGGEFPLDSLLKVSCCGIGIIGEVYTGFHDGKFTYLTNAQHSTMFAMFMLAGIFELLNFYKIFSFFRCCDYFFNFLAIVTECVLFAFHLHGRTPTDIYVHTILIYVLIVLIVVGLCEVVFLHSLTAGLLRSVIIIAQGSWFWQVGAILYPPLPSLPAWDELAIESIPRSTNIFIWHVICVFGFVCLTAAIMGIPLRNPPANASVNRADQRRLLAEEGDVDSDNSGSETEILEMRQWKTNY
ncbi:Transmembrane protein 45B [Echinococcus multilocularis]|uniref:Transmembrane protein 45B n=1 Tax=Echinococcus multilocularis TaxID=6211 RepID=A0A068Y156_ECHMU|nr:Transmembrane protein 45B [Echinococcus multilocularis]